VVLGDMRFKTWYPSFHPEELVGRETETLYVCQWCFKYACDMRQYLTHLNSCHAKQAGPPGRIIYQKLPYSIYEVDGEEHKLFTQNLSLFAKLFLDNKSVFFDVSTFNYYLLVQEPIPGYQPSNKLLDSSAKKRCPGTITTWPVYSCFRPGNSRA